MIENIFSNISLKLLADSVTLPVHEPISFGFEDMVNAKAEADSEFRCKAEPRMTAGGNEVRYFPKRAGIISESALASKSECGLVLAAELAALTNQKRKKNNKSTV